MFAASRFFHPAAHPSIKQLLENKIAEASKTGNCHIATIQAIIILVFWQEPDDRSVWLKSGLAIRMAYQAGLHKAPNVSPTDRTTGDVRYLRVSQRVSVIRKVENVTFGIMLCCIEWAAHLVLQVALAIFCRQVQQADIACQPICACFIRSDM